MSETAAPAGPAAQLAAFVAAWAFSFLAMDLGAAFDYVVERAARLVAFGARVARWVAVVAALIGALVAPAAPAAAAPAPVPAVLAQ